MDEYRFPDSCIQIFAKAPVIGQVKTRMQPVLSEQQSLSLHRKMVAHCLRQACDSRLAPVQLWATASHEYWGELAQQYAFRLHLQVGDGLGERMAHALRDGLAGNRSVVLIGSDCPFIDRNYLAQAFAALAGATPIVLGPARDGGYVLLGLNRFDARIFEQIPWGSEKVLERTVRQLSAIGWPYSQLAAMTDIDHPGDIECLRAPFPQLLSQ
jgi:hypothetical protein